MLANQTWRSDKVMSTRLQYPLTKWSMRILTAFIAVLLLIVTLTITNSYSSISLGTLISEKLLGRDGVGDSSLLLSSATNTELSILGFAPIVSTQTATNKGVGGGITTATLQGTVTNMNGMPSATGYFEWGYAAGALTNTTTTFAVTGIGDYSLAITGFIESSKVYYRFVTDTDGTAYGDVSEFALASGAGTSILLTLLRIIVAAGILVTIIMLGRNGGTVAMLLAAVIGLVGFAVIDIFLRILVH